MPAEDQRTYWQKHYEYNSEDEENSLNMLHDKIFKREIFEPLEYWNFQKENSKILNSQTHVHFAAHQKSISKIQNSNFLIISSITCNLICLTNLQADGRREVIMKDMALVV